MIARFSKPRPSSYNFRYLFLGALFFGFVSLTFITIFTYMLIGDAYFNSSLFYGEKSMSEKVYTDLDSAICPGYSLVQGIVMVPYVVTLGG